MTASARRTWPWRPGDLVALYLANLVGAAVLTVAWLEASGYVSLQHQVPWLDAAIAGVIVAAVGNVSWLLVGRRSVGKLRRQLTSRLEP